MRRALVALFSCLSMTAQANLIPVELEGYYVNDGSLEIECYYELTEYAPDGWVVTTTIPCEGS